MSVNYPTTVFPCPSNSTVSPVLASAWRDVTALASAFIETMQSEEQIAAMTALQGFVAVFPVDEQLEALAVFLNGFPGFRSFVAEQAVRQ